jgi:type I restriction enzyme S subunit
MAAYPTAPLRDVCAHVEYGYTASSTPDSSVGPRFLRITDIVPERLDWESVPFCAIEPKKLTKHRLRTGDIVIARTGATTGWAKYIKDPPEAVFASYLVRVRPVSTVDARYIGFVVESSVYKDFIQQHMGGAAQPNANAQVLTSFEIPLPPLPIQRRIAGILSAYDELIENSQRRIKILESMARALYREWFVHFRFPGHESVPRVPSPLGEIPQGWEVKKLGEIVENFDRLRKPLSKMQRSEMQGEYPYYGAAKVFDYVNSFIFDGEYLLMAEDGSVITTERNPVLQLVNEKFWPNNHTHVLRGKPPVSTHFLYLGLSEVDVSPYITGAAQPKITQENMNRIPFFCAPEKLHHDFNRLVEPEIRQAQLLQRQIQNLRRTRDLLLPRLLSGQIDVEALDHA